VPYYEVSLETVQSLARSAPTMVGARLPQSIIAPASRLFGTARMFQTGLRVFRTFDETYAALGITAPK
jgi:hypothetical protein